MATEELPPIAGICDERFRRVREEFTENFNQRGERGGSVAIWYDGRVVVDLWGGWSDLGRLKPWERDTIVNFFSVSKALCTIAIMRLADCGKLDLDARVADYWPQFAAAGKETITVRQLMSHQGGLPAIREPLPDGAAMDWDVITRALAAQAPWWKPGTAHGYHVNTFGFLAGELVRRVSGRSIGTLLREDVAQPLGADVHIGLPAAEHHRVSDFLWPGESRQTGDRQRRRFDALEHLLESAGLFGIALGEHCALARSGGAVNQRARQFARRRTRLCRAGQWRHD